MRPHNPSYIKHLMDETKSNIRFPLLGQVMLGITKLILTSRGPQN